MKPGWHQQTFVLDLDVESTVILMPLTVAYYYSIISMDNPAGEVNHGEKSICDEESNQ